MKRIEAARVRESVLQRRFLTELLYNKGSSFRADAPELSLRQLKTMLAENAQGTWILCTDIAAAKEIVAGVSPCPIDLFIGNAPTDRRAFNTLAVCPEGLELPGSLRRVVVAGMPVPEDVPEGAESYILPLPSPLGRELPTVGQMREVYKACMRLIRRPVHITDWEMLDLLLSEESGLSLLCCRASALALLDMKLIYVGGKPFSLRLPPMKKTDPESSALWRALQGYKKFVEGRNAEDE